MEAGEDLTKAEHGLAEFEQRLSEAGVDITSAELIDIRASLAYFLL